MRSITRAAIAALALGSAGAHANLLYSGGFEDVYDAQMEGWGGYTFYQDGVLPGWRVVSGSVDVTVNGSSWGPAYEGNHALDLNGWEAGSIAQTFQTVAGQSYQIDFAYSRNVLSGPADVGALLQVMHHDGSWAPDAMSFSVSGATGWQQGSLRFTATDAWSSIYFSALTPSNGGVYLDAVSVTAVPEPTSVAMMLAGMGVLGWLARRRA